VRAKTALVAEGIIATDALLNELADAAWNLEEKCYPGPAMNDPEIRRSISAGANGIKKQGKALCSNLKRLREQIDNSGRLARGEIVEKLAARSISPEVLETVFDAIQVAGESLTKCEPPEKIKALTRQGNTVKPQGAWAQAVWQTLKKQGVTMEAAGRILSTVFQGDDSQAATLYQTIRNAENR
jgi:hypothetical protein